MNVLSLLGLRHTAAIRLQRQKARRLGMVPAKNVRIEFRFGRGNDAGNSTNKRPHEAYTRKDTTNGECQISDASQLERKWEKNA